MKVDDFISSGSGSIIAYGLLETMYRKDMTTKEGIDLALKAVNAAMQRDSASGNGIVIYVVTKEGIKKVFDKDLEATIKM